MNQKIAYDSLQIVGNAKVSKSFFLLLKTKKKKKSNQTRLGELGSGLGLSICVGLARRMGYNLLFNSQTGKGTQVEMSFNAPVSFSKMSGRVFDEIRLMGLGKVSNEELSHLPQIARTRWEIPVVESEALLWSSVRSLYIADCAEYVPEEFSKSTMAVCKDPLLCDRTVNCISHCVLVRKMFLCFSFVTR